MNWIDTGYLLFKNKYNENSVIAEIFTKNHGKCSGIIFGATSKKIKNYLQIGNKLHLEHTYKNQGRIGYFKVEIEKVQTPKYFDDQKKLLCIASAMNLVKLLTAESQENLKIFKLIDNFFLFLDDKNWLKNYIFWELELLKLIGYDLELKNIVNEEIIDDKVTYFVKSNTEKKIVPNFMIDLNDSELDNVILLKGLTLVGDYLEKSILKPNNIHYPSSRFDLLNNIK